MDRDLMVKNAGRRGVSPYRSSIRGPRVSVPGPFGTQMGWLSDRGSGALSFKNGIDIPFCPGDC
jgi:hypothetical protein